MIKNQISVKQARYILYCVLNLISSLSESIQFNLGSISHPIRVISWVMQLHRYNSYLKHCHNSCWKSVEISGGVVFKNEPVEKNRKMCHLLHACLTYSIAFRWQENLINFQLSFCTCHTRVPPRTTFNMKHVDVWSAVSIHFGWVCARARHHNLAFRAQIQALFGSKDLWCLQNCPKVDKTLPSPKELHA